jgi:prepilin-type N-terminal cleavage/methylation domain-containing protein
MESLKKRVQARGQGGFTLIELLVVIAILAILAGVVVFAVGNSTSNAKVSACKTERASLITAIAAANTANLSNGPESKEDYTKYLSSPLNYFTVAGGAVNSAASPDTATAITGTTRINTSAAPTTDCDVLSASEYRFDAIP